MLAEYIVYKYTTSLMRRSAAVIEHLVGLGLNELEAQVYLFLLSHKPMTAYGVARQIGKATANTYKAIESLARRGAVLVEDGDNRQCRAVPVREFMAHLERTFSERTRAAELTLASLHSRHMMSVYTKWNQSHNCWSAAGRWSADRAERLITVDAFPNALERIAPDLRDAASRGIAVYVQAYAPIEIEGGLPSSRQWEGKRRRTGTHNNST